MLSNSSKYALKAVLYIAQNASKENKKLIREISGQTKIPKAYLAKVLQDLSRHNLVKSVKGPKGGFYLSKKNKNTPIIEFIHVIDGERRLTSCVLGVNDCNADNPCPIHHLVGDAKTAFVKNLEENTINDLILHLSRGKSVLPL